MDQNAEIISKALEGSLAIIDQDREKEIISRRFGLTGRKETLEQIGEMLNITRERVRQLEKAILIRLRITAEENHIPELIPAEKLIIRHLTEMGRAARITDLAQKIYGRIATAEEKASIAFIGDISATLTTIDENDRYYPALSIAEYGDSIDVKAKVDEIVAIIKANKVPMTPEQLYTKLPNYDHPDHIVAVASISKQLATLGDLWGLAKWPTVNPRNIRDKIYVVLDTHKSPMHFSEIADAIKHSTFKRRDVTIQAIHNELIKDPRFVLIGRGIYALDTWGYTKGTVSDTIAYILTQANTPLTREEIVKRVLRSRKVKETTILLNLQNKDIFKKVDRNTYTLAKSK